MTAERSHHPAGSGNKVSAGAEVGGTNPAYIRCGRVSLILLAVCVGLAGCQTAPSLPPVPSGGRLRTGQVLYAGPARSIVGEFSMRSSPGDFQLDVSKGPVNLMSVREVAGQVARFEGGGRSWQGNPSRAPKPLRSWLELDDVFAGRRSGGSWSAKTSGGQTRVEFPATGERFVFRFDHSQP